MAGVQLMGILLVGTSKKFGKGKGPAKKSKGSDDDDRDSDGGSTTNGDTSGRYIRPLTLTKLQCCTYQKYPH